MAAVTPIALLIHQPGYNPSASFQDMRINHRRAYVFVPEQFMYRADIVSILQQVCGK
jgi:hypothetical protein